MKTALLVLPILALAACGPERVTLTDERAAQMVWARFLVLGPEPGQSAGIERQSAKAVYTDRVLQAAGQGRRDDLGLMSYRFARAPSGYAPRRVVWLDGDGAEDSTGVVVMAADDGGDRLLVPARRGPGRAIRFDLGEVGAVAPW